ncbi:MAG: DNA repair protein RadC [Candidatus Rifleibacteriota bacterium]
MSEKNANEGHRERIRHRFDNAGLNSFAEHEILELVLTYAIPRVDTKVIAKGLLREFGSLEGVFAANSDAICKVKGIGPAGARLLRLISEVAKYVVKKKAFGDAPVISSASALIDYLGATMANLPEEQFRVIFLDNSNRIIKDEVLSDGIEDQTAVYPRKVVKRALMLNSTGIIVVHNHPTGQLMPSSADRNITRMLVNACETLDLRFLDHIIVGREGKGYFSFRENGLI